jgi:hypothetical protein
MLEHLGHRLSGIALPSSPDLFTFALLGPWSRLDHHTFEIRDADSILATCGKFLADECCRGCSDAHWAEASDERGGLIRYRNSPV